MLTVNTAGRSSSAEDDGPTGGEPVVVDETSDWTIDRCQPFLESHSNERA